MKTLLLALLLLVSTQVFSQSRTETKTISSDSTWSFDNNTLGDPYVGGTTHGMESGDSLRIYDIVSVGGTNDTCLVPVKRFDTGVTTYGKLVLSSSVPVEFIIDSPFVHRLFIRGYNVSSTAKIRKESKSF